MRPLAIVMVALTLTACAGANTDRSSSTTTTTLVATTTTNSSHMTTIPQANPATSTTAPEPSDDSGESISVTERVTIVITDPEGG